MPSSRAAVASRLLRADPMRVSIVFNYRIWNSTTPSGFDLPMDWSQRPTGVTLTEGRWCPAQCFIYPAPVRGPVAYPLPGVICLLAGLSLALSSSGRRGWCRIADSVFFQTAPNMGVLVLMAWSANEKAASVGGLSICLCA